MSARLSPSRRKFWKTYQPTTLRAALEGCKEHAREAGTSASSASPPTWG
ncbi:hypothetical protein H0I39_01895 [Ottowia beijingensis]|uniref:Uncharacterized protein n=1 Tax=Ottowia beijingensis TaxID=1207057 RepID=A0A853IJF7_9BURK|nr:hypothetical protein [Ottowia beijingensis]NZA00843.1 hypothetical protein [Ottowia beijingensis]